MKIAIDIRSLTAPHKTGVGIVTESLVRTLAAQAPNDTFFLFATGTEDTLMNLPIFREHNIVLSPVTIPNKIASMLWALPFGPTMERFLPEVPDAWLFPNAHLLKTKLPYAVIFHDAALRTVPNFFTFKDHLRARITNEDRVFQNAQQVIAVSQHSKKDAAEYYRVPLDRVTVADLGVDHDVYSSREQSSDRSYRAAYDLNRPYLLALATREPRKNIDSVITAYTVFRQQGGQAIPLVLAGAKGWKTRHIDAALTTSMYRNDIREVAYVPEKHKAAVIRGAKALLFPSFYEGFGLPVLEAMACGTPVITSITSSLPDVAGNAALFVDPLNITDIVQALHQLLDEPHGPKLQEILKTRGIERAQRFSWKKTSETVLKVLHEISS
ncbi:MAG: glycosyltransferase family 1 protein [Patescibacteria group bacterium]